MLSIYHGIVWFGFAQPNGLAARYDGDITLPRLCHVWAKIVMADEGPPLRTKPILFQSAVSISVFDFSARFVVYPRSSAHRLE